MLLVFVVDFICITAGLEVGPSANTYKRSEFIIKFSS